MRRLGVVVLVVGMVLPVFAKATKRTAAPVTTQRVTVVQLEQVLAADREVPDKKLAGLILDMGLTERLSDAELARLQKTLPGRRSQRALLAVADESAFLDPPAAEIPALPVPDHATQEALINKAMGYVLKQIPTLPDFFATRVTTRFSGTPQVISTDLHEALFPYLADTQRLTDVGTTSATVRYSKGLEVFTDRKGVKTECYISNGAGGSSGEFGEILTRVAYEATQGKVIWSHWEQGPAGPLAVFHYEAKLMYKFPRRCRNEIDVPPTMVDFQGEIDINPADGSILRLTELDRFNGDLFGLGSRMEGANTMVEYGFVEIGGSSTHLCPVKSVYVAFGPPFLGTRIDFDRFDKNWGLSEDPIAEGVNDIVFTDYHLFRAKVRILTGAAAEPDAAPQPPASTPQ